MNPMTWNDLPDIVDVPKLEETDEKCLAEVGEVLRKYSKTRRFGVALLHQHFKLRDDELMVEHCNFETRTLVTAPEPASSVISKGYLPTVWRYDGELAQGCAFCPTHGSQHDGHKESH
jgi:hypothetical protein